MVHYRVLHHHVAHHHHDAHHHVTYHCAHYRHAHQYVLFYFTLVAVPIVLFLEYCIVVMHTVVFAVVATGHLSTVSRQRKQHRTP